MGGYEIDLVIFQPKLASSYFTKSVSIIEPSSVEVQSSVWVWIAKMKTIWLLLSTGDTGALQSGFARLSRPPTEHDGRKEDIMPLKLEEAPISM